MNISPRLSFCSGDLLTSHQMLSPKAFCMGPGTPDSEASLAPESSIQCRAKPLSLVSEPSAVSQEVTNGKLRQGRAGGIALPFHMKKLILCTRHDGCDRNPMASSQGCPQTPNPAWGRVLCEFDSGTQPRLGTTQCQCQHMMG